MSYLLDKLPTTEESFVARSCRQELSAILDTKVGEQDITLTDREGVAHKISVPVSALYLMVEFLTQLGEGNMVKLVPISAELTAQEAADLLNLSRPTLIKLLDEGALPYHRAGNRRKILPPDLQAYQEQLKRDRVAALSELNKLDQEQGMGYE